MQNKTQKIVLAALLASLTCVATMLIKVPSPLKGYVNLGDCVVLLCGWILSPVYGFLAAGVGSGLADVFSGYIIYAPATFVIKGLMALVAYFGFKAINIVVSASITENKKSSRIKVIKLFKLLLKKAGNLPARIASGFLAEVVMVGGYFLFEGRLYGFIASAVNIPFNAVQGAAGLILGIILVRIFEKSDIIR